MAKERGWWSISFTTDPSESDLEHIAELVRDGFREGEIVADEADGEEEGEE